MKAGGTTAEAKTCTAKKKNLPQKKSPQNKQASNHSRRHTLRQCRHVNGRCCYHGSVEEDDRGSEKHMQKKKIRGGRLGLGVYCVRAINTRACVSVHKRVGMHV